MIAIAITVAVAPIQPAVLVLFQQIVNKYLCVECQKGSRGAADLDYLLALFDYVCSTLNAVLWGSAFDVLHIVIGGQTDDDERVSSVYH